MSVLTETIKGAEGNKTDSVRAVYRVDFPIVAVVDEEGIEHYGVNTHYISQEEWNKFVADGKPDMIGVIGSDGVDGPGYYWLAGSDPYTGFDKWKRVAIPLARRGQLITMNGIM